jgi:hypothetical protein
MTTADFAALAFLVYLLVILLVFAMPFMALSVTLSLRGIHRELKRVNDARQAQAAPAPNDLPTWRPDPPAASLGHQLLR